MSDEQALRLLHDALMALSLYTFEMDKAFDAAPELHEMVPDQIGEAIQDVFRHLRDKMDVKEFEKLALSWLKEDEYREKNS